MSRQLGSIGYLLWQQDLVPFLSKSSYTQKQGVQTSFIWVQTYKKCERSELCLHFEWTKFHLKMPEMVHFGDLLKS